MYCNCIAFFCIVNATRFLSFTHNAIALELSVEADAMTSHTAPAFQFSSITFKRYHHQEEKSRSKRIRIITITFKGLVILTIVIVVHLNRFGCVQL